MKKEIVIGHFEMGWQSVTLILRDGTGGEFIVGKEEVKP